MSTRRASILGSLFVLAFVLLILGLRAARSHDLSEGVGVLCDTRAQIEQFASLNASLDAIASMNTEKVVCAMANVRYIYGHSVGQVRMSDRTVEVVEVLVVQVFILGQWSNIPPEVQYTLFQVEEEPV